MNINKIKSRKNLSIALVLCMILTLFPLGISLPQTVRAESKVYDISSGPLEIAYLADSAQYDDYMVIQSGTEETPNEITVPRNYTGTITLSGVTIVAANPIKYGGTGAYTANYTIELDGINVLTATTNPAVPVLRDMTVTFKAKTHTELDSLDATGGTAIGAPGNTAAGAVIVESGTITATATTNSNSPAIGSGPWHQDPGVGSDGTRDSFSLMINGGKVTANASNRSAIGNGAQGAAGKVTVNGGELIATAGWGANAIGGTYGTGTYFKGPEVVINGGNVTLSSGEGGAAIGFGGAPAGVKLATGSVTITGGNIKINGRNASAIGGGTPYVDEDTDYLCLESIVILPEANLSGTIHGFEAGIAITGTVKPIIGRAKNIFYMNGTNLTSVGNENTPTAALSLETIAANINVFVDFSGYSAVLSNIIKTAYTKKTGIAPASSEFNMGITNASGSLPLYCYNNFAADASAAIEFTAAGWKSIPATGAAASAINGSAAVTYTASGNMATATPLPSPAPTLPPSSDTRLRSLTYVTSFGTIATVPGFSTSQSQGEYTVTVPYGKTAVRLMAVPAHGKTTAAIDSGGAIALNPEGTTSANVTVTAQDGTKNVFKVNFVQGAYLQPKEDRVWFADDGIAAMSSGDAAKWNGAGGTGALLAELDQGDGNKVKHFYSNTAGAAISLSKGFLEFEQEAVISTRLYISAEAGKKTSSAKLNIDGKTLVDFKDNGQYMAGGVSKAYTPNEWVSVDFHIKPAETGAGSTYVEKKASSWSNATVMAWVNGELAGTVPININYTQQIMGNNSNVPSQGWGSASLPTLKIDVEPLAGNCAELLIDDMRIYEPHEFVLADMQIDKHSDQARNIKLDSRVEFVFNHAINLSSFDSSTMTVLEEGTAFTPTSITVDPAMPNKIVVDFANTPMKPYTFYEFTLANTFADVTGRAFSPYGRGEDSIELQFTTGGEEGDWPPPIECISPEVGEAFIMPDIYNTGYKSKFEDLVSITSKYPGLRVNGNWVYIDKNAVAMYGNVFSGFKLDPGRLVITASNVVVEDFYVDMHREGHNGPLTVTGGAKNVLVQDGELKNGSGAIVDGENVKLLRMHMHASNGDALKPATNWWVESCYMHNLGNAHLAHADGAQISGDATKLVNDIRMYGNRFDTPAMPFINVSNTPLWLALNFGDATNMDIQYNWYNGGGYGSAIGGYPFILTNVTYNNNRMGVGKMYGALRYDREKENQPSHDIHEPIMLEELDIPSAGSVVYYNADGKPAKGSGETEVSYERRKRNENRIYNLADAGEKLTVMVNFANYTTRAQDVKVVAEVYDKDGNLKTAAPQAQLAPLPRYITPQEYYSDPVNEYLEQMRLYLVNECSLDVSFSGISNNNAKAEELAKYNYVLKPWVEDVLNNDPTYNIRADWWLREVPKTAEDKMWYLGLKTAPDLPCNVEREFTFDLPSNLASGDYVEVSVYKDWDDTEYGEKPDELLRAADRIYFDGEPAAEPEFAVSNLKISKSGTYSIAANVKNTFTGAKSVNFIVAVYDGTKLLDVQSIPQTVNAGDDKMLRFGYTPTSAFASKPTNTVKVMAWDTDMVPLCAAYECAVSGIVVE